MHDSGPVWVANPSPYDSLIHYTSPVSPAHKDLQQHHQRPEADRRVPSSPFDSPSLPPNLPPAIGETAVVLGAARGTTNYLLLSANLRRPAAPCHVTRFRPQAHQRVARNDPKESRKVALRLISRGSSLSALARRAPARWAFTRSPVILQLGPEPSGFRRHRSGVHG